MTSQLRYYMHDEYEALRFELAGSLSGARAESVYKAWQTSLSTIGNRQLIIDITFVASADERGCAVLNAWHRNGARIIASSPESQALIETVLSEDILGERLPVTQPKRSWLQRQLRCRAWLLRL